MGTRVEALRGPCDRHDAGRDRLDLVADASVRAQPYKPAARCAGRGRLASTRSSTSIVIMQENRSFDSYFGTYPGAVGIPKTSACPTRAEGNASSRSPTHLDKNMNEPHGEGGQQG